MYYYLKKSCGVLGVLGCPPVVWGVLGVIRMTGFSVPISQLRGQRFKRFFKRVFFFFFFPKNHIFLKFSSSAF